MPGKVADASVIAAIAFGEPRAQEALRLIDGYQLFEPVVLAYELASVCLKKVRLQPYLGGKVLQMLDDTLSLVPFTWMETDHAAAVRVALETGLSSYDGAYLHLARQLDVPLATFDERLKSSLKGSAK